MKTSITTFQEKIQGDLHFPVMTEYGIIEDYDLGLFLRAQTELGNHMPMSQVNALAAFMSTAKSEGWYNNILYALPLIVLDNKKSIAIPLIANNREPLTIGWPSQGYDASTDFDIFISGDGKGIITHEAMTLVSRMTGETFYKKHPLSENRNTNRMGYTMVGYFTSKPEDGASRFFGYDMGGLTIVSGVSPSKNWNLAMFTQGYNNSTLGENINLFNYINSFVRPVSDTYIIGVEYGEIDDNLTAGESARKEPVVITDFTEIQDARIAINSAWRSNTILSNAPDFIMYFLLFHDGTITDARYPNYRLALNTLLSALGKV